MAFATGCGSVGNGARTLITTVACNVRSSMIRSRLDDLFECAFAAFGKREARPLA